jgi:hypothetical protein
MKERMPGMSDAIQRLAVFWSLAVPLGMLILLTTVKVPL